MSRTAARRTLGSDWLRPSRAIAVSQLRTQLNVGDDAFDGAPGDHAQRLRRVTASVSA